MWVRPVKRPRPVPVRTPAPQQKQGRVAVVARRCGATLDFSPSALSVYNKTGLEPDPPLSGGRDRDSVMTGIAATGDAMETAVEIVEVSPRDGLQNERTPVSTADKLELIRRAVAAGVRRLEATSFVNPKRVPQMADAEAVMEGVPRVAGVRYIGLVLNERGFARAAAAGCDEVNYVLVASDTFSERNNGAPTLETLRGWAEVAAIARREGIACGVTIGASFGCPFEGEVPVERVVEVARRAAEHGPVEIALADTIGVAAPTDVIERFAAVAAACPGVRLRAHFHNTRNTGLANAYAAVQAGVRVLDSSIGGVGGCPFAPAATGNIPTEDLAYMLRRMGVATGLDLASLIETASWLEGKLGRQAPAMLGRAGLFPEGVAAACTA